MVRGREQQVQRQRSRIVMAQLAFEKNCTASQRSRLLQPNTHLGISPPHKKKAPARRALELSKIPLREEQKSVPGSR